MAFALNKGNTVGGCCAIGSISGFYVFADPITSPLGMKRYQKELRADIAEKITRAKKAGESLLFASLREDQVDMNEPALLEAGFKKVFDEPSYRDPGYSTNGSAMFVYLKQINPGINRNGEYLWTPLPANYLALCSTPKKEG